MTHSPALSLESLIEVAATPSEITSITVNGSLRTFGPDVSARCVFVVGRDPKQLTPGTFGDRFPSALPERAHVLLPAAWHWLSSVHCVMWMRAGRLQILTAKGTELALCSSTEVLADGLTIRVLWPVESASSSSWPSLDDLVAEEPKSALRKLRDRLAKHDPALEFDRKAPLPGTIEVELDTHKLSVAWTGTTGPRWKTLNQLLGNFVSRWRHNHKHQEAARRIHEAPSCPSLATAGKHLRELHANVVDAAVRELPLVIYGESGVGKTRLARCYHEHSPWAKGAFIHFDCGLYGPDETRELKAKLFGARRATWTSLNHDIPGAVELAQNGVLFLDEVGELKPELQTLLLRFLNDGTFERLGDDKAQESNARLVFATHRDLYALAQAGVFRPDLLYRITTGKELTLPPLRQRSDELRLLLEREVTIKPYGTFPPVWDRLDASAREFVLSHSWKGNFRTYDRFRVLFPRGRNPGTVTRSECESILLGRPETPSIEALLPDIDVAWRRQVRQDLDEQAHQVGREGIDPGGEDLYARLKAIHERALKDKKGRGSKGVLSQVGADHLVPLFVAWKASVLFNCRIADLPKTLQKAQLEALTRDLLTLNHETVAGHYRSFHELQARAR